MFKDRKRFCEMVDPLLQGQYPVRGLYQVLAIAAMCVQEQPSMRPVIADVVTALNYLECQKYDPQFHLIQSSRTGYYSSRPTHQNLRSTLSYGSEPRPSTGGHKLLVSDSGSESEIYVKGLSSPRTRSDGHQHFYTNNDSETDSSAD